MGQDFCPCVGVAATAWRLLRGQVTSCVASGGREASTVFSVIDDVGRRLFLLKAPPLPFTAVGAGQCPTSLGFSAADVIPWVDVTPRDQAGERI